MLEAERQFRKIIGYRDLAALAKELVSPEGESGAHDDLMETNGAASREAQRSGWRARCAGAGP